MGQVPAAQYSYLIIGDGRAAKNCKAYFSRLHLPLETYSRKENSPIELKAKIKIATHVLLLINDDQIDSFYKSNDELREKICVHFSGALVHPEIPSAHPLMTFTGATLSPDLQDQMAFVIEAEGPAFSTLLPDVPNRHVRLNQKEKAKYHAWCVMSGNFTTILWEATARTFQSELRLDQKILIPYLTAISKNLADEFLENSDSQLTGPFVRNDLLTIQSHLFSLKDQPFEKIYKAFWSAYQTQDAQRV